MKNLLDSVIGNELFFVYTLIILVVILIILIVLIDKKNSKKSTQNLFDTLNMKIIANPDEVKRDTIKEENKDIEIKTINTTEIKDEFVDLEPINEVEVIGLSSELKEVVKEIEEEPYVESELEKTQAQIRVEEITKALEKADIEEKIQKDKYEIFEEEQEKNAIISYNELIKEYDKLYSENEKIQYLEDDEIPINIDELYKMQDKENEVKKVEIEDFVTLKEKVVEEKPKVVDTTFKSSPYISPVYGIQTPPIDIKTSTDSDIENANQFLQSLKDLKNNLD